MPYLRRLPWVNIVLMTVLVAGAAIAFSLSQANTSAEQKKARLETRAKAVELDLSEAKKGEGTALESLRQSLEQAQSALAESSLPSQAEREQEINLENLRQSLEQALAALEVNLLSSQTSAMAATDQIMRYALINNITIVGWDSSYSSINLKSGAYPAINNHISVEGEIDALISFLRALAQASIAPVIQGMDITALTGTTDIWQMSLELVVYYQKG